MKQQTEHDFSQGSVRGNILRLAGPMTLAQLINLLYNIIDRMYIGHLPKDSTLALTGLGLTFPILMLVTAFTNLFGMGGAPLFSIARGKQDNKRAARIMGTTFTMLFLSGILLTILGLLFKKPLLYLFGASDSTFPFADTYLSIYLLGNVFVMFSLGMNNFINAQGFAKKGMLTVLIGAVLNIILDPVFIFILDMGVAGAALATILSQMISALWVLRFTDREGNTHWPDPRQSAYSSAPSGRNYLAGRFRFYYVFYQQRGSDSMQRLSSKFWRRYLCGCHDRNKFHPGSSLYASTGDHQCRPARYGFNSGAKKPRRVRGEESLHVSGLHPLYYGDLDNTSYFSEAIYPPFNSNSQLLQLGVPSMTIYFFGFFMMSFQFSGQSTFVALGRSKSAIFSLFRKVIIVIPLTLLLPHVGGLGVYGVFLGGTHLQFYRRRRLFLNHDAHCLARTKKTGAGTKQFFLINISTKREPAAFICIQNATAPSIKITYQFLLSVFGSPEFALPTP